MPSDSIPTQAMAVEPMLQTMFHLQNKMNQKVHPQWQDQGYEWYRAIWIECAELMDHQGWKWWKKQEPNRDQVVLEIIDIWHFGLSILLQQHQDTSQVSRLIQDAMTPSHEAPPLLIAVESFAAACLNNKTFDVPKFVLMMQAADLSFVELFQRYVGKNVLNIFRQDNGYKTGEYRKEWQGKEDNEHLVELVNALDYRSATFEQDLYSALESRYNQPQATA